MESKNGTCSGNDRCSQCSKRLVQLKAKQWVRMKRGIFKDDLAQVVITKFFL